MEGTFLEGFGDGSGTVLALNPIALTDEGRQQLAKYESNMKTEEAAVVRAVIEQIEGFEGPYGLELLASTHWVMRREPAEAKAPAKVRGWTRRKGHLYSDGHVNSAVTHLKAVGAV
jgi:hypothetical protein